MRIGINCLTINPAYTGGIKIYTHGLLHGFSELPPTAHYNIYATENNKHLFDELASKKNFSVRVVSDYDSRLKRFALWRLAMLKAKKPYKLLANFFYYKLSVTLSAENDILYFPNTVINPFNYTRPTVLSMHDIQQVHFPEFFNAQELADRYVNYNLSAENVTCMQASSEFIGKDFLSYFKCLDESQVEVIQEGVDIPLFRKARDLEHMRTKYNIPSGYLFFPAQLWHHKNHMCVLRALLKLKEQGLTIPMVLVGAQYSSAANIFRFIKDHGMTSVHYLGKVPFDDLVAMYQDARFLITAVLYESSSLPILEAAAAGTAIIASDTPPNQELGRRLKVNLFDPHNSDELADLLARLWNDTALTESQVAHNREHIEHFTWKNIAARYLALFERIVNNPIARP